MTQLPTGRLECSPDTPTLVYERLLPVASASVWAALTEPGQTARWIGRWTGVAEAGRTVEFVWLAEEGAPIERVMILTCDPPRRLALAAGPDPATPWLMTIELEDLPDGTRLEFRQLMSNGLSPAIVGPAWEFYLDRLTAVLAEEPPPVWNDRYHQMQSHYEELQAAMALCEEA
ncbi:MAG: SRPBCC domain-containing protein [Thermomicrobiales bacterium]|nr:SRPBCC domain-containing protein [Thermomicrobiales bacterium]